MEKAKYVEANEVAKVASEVRGLFFQGLTDDDIGSKLKLENSAVSHLRNIMGLRRRAMDLKVNPRFLSTTKGAVRLNTVTLTSIVEELGLDINKKYEWIATNVKKGEFTVDISKVKQ